VDTMRDIVLHGRGRPEIPSSWLVHQVSWEQLVQKRATHLVPLNSPSLKILTAVTKAKAGGTPGPSLQLPPGWLSPHKPHKTQLPGV